MAARHSFLLAAAMLAGHWTSPAPCMASRLQEAGYTRPVPVTHRLSKESREETNAAIRGVIQRLLALRDGPHIGEEDGAEEYLLGRIDGVLIDRSGNIIVADGLAHNVRVYDRNGVHLSTIGGKGDGPGEFRRPSRLALDELDRLYVVDRLVRVQRFQRVNGSFEYLDSFRMEMKIEDLCVMGGNLYVQGFRVSGYGNTVLQKLTLTGEHIASFGDVYRSPNRRMIEHMTRGRIACDENVGSVLYMPRQVPAEVRAYTLDGDIRWITTFPEIEQLLIELTERGIRQTVPETGFHVGASFEVVPGGVLIIQLGFITLGSRAAGDEFARLETYMLDVATGAGTYVADTPPLIRAAADTVFVAAIRDPFPQLRIHR